MSDLRPYLANLSTALDGRDGVTASDLLSINDAHAKNRKLVQQIESVQVLKDAVYLSRGHATLHLAVSVRPSVRNIF